MMMSNDSQMSRNLADYKRIKDNIEGFAIYFKSNYRRFNEFKRYVYDTAINTQQRAILVALNKPQIEFNMIEAFINRLLGEFSMHEPSFVTRPIEGEPVPPEILNLVRGHVRYIVYDANKSSCNYRVYKDLLSGGFSVMKYWTEYSSPMSMQQVIRVGRVFDPTLCGFDPMAREPHKGDGNYSFELFPMTVDDFKVNYPNTDVSDLSYNRSTSMTNNAIGPFSWSYTNNKGEKFLMVGEYFEKKKKRIKICKIATGQTVPLKKYKKVLEEWDRIEQPPVIVGEPRWTVIDVIHRYVIIEKGIIEHTETDYRYLPHIFVDGNSEVLVEGESSGSSYQMTRPYAYQARGVQDLLNCSGQTIAANIERQIQSKYIVKKEAIPQEAAYQANIKNLQQATTIVVNAFCDNNPDKPIPEPIRETVNVPCPPEIYQTFSSAAQIMQSILGSFSSNVGQQDVDMSGKAIIESATVGNAASMPYMVGYLQALTQLGNCIVDLIPKYMVGERHLPVVQTNGSVEYVKVNGKMENDPQLVYDANSIAIEVTPGLNFQVQKNQSLAQLNAAMRSSQEFNAFMNSEEGLPIYVKNLTIYGADELAEAVPKWLQKQQMMQQQQMQMQQQMIQNDPQRIAAQAMIMKEQNAQVQHQTDSQLEVAKLGIQDKLADSKIMEAQAKISMMGAELDAKMQDDETSRINHALDLAGRLASEESRQHADKLKTHAALLAEKKLEHDISKDRTED